MAQIPAYNVAVGDVLEKGAVVEVLPNDEDGILTVVYEDDTTEPLGYGDTVTRLAEGRADA